MALQGSLSDFGIAEILQLIGTQQKTGILHVKGVDDGEEVHVFFASGRIIRCDVAGRDRRDRLGAMLLDAGVISKEQLNAALKVQKSTLKRVGDVLVEQGALTPDVLQQFNDLQTRETLYRLFEWKTGTYAFEGKPPNFTRPVGTPISSESLLMEGFRMLDEWPLIRARISNFGIVFKTLKDLEDLETEADALERILDDAFSEFVDASVDAGRPKGATGAPSNLGRSERRVLTLIDGKRDVTQIIDRSRLGEFETCKALVTLMDEGFIAPARRAKPQEQPGRQRRRDWRDVVGRGVINVAALGAIAAAVLFMPRSRIEIHQNTQEVASEAYQRLRTNRLVALATALEVYRVENGTYPDTLTVLVEADLVESDLLTPPGETPFDYVAVGDDYVLQ